MPPPRGQELREYDVSEVPVHQEKFSTALDRILWANKIFKLRRSFPLLTDSEARGLVSQALGMDVDGTSDDEADVVSVGSPGNKPWDTAQLGTSHVKELCQQIAVLLTDLGPLCGLMALHACLDQDMLRCEHLPFRCRALKLDQAPKTPFEWPELPFLCLFRCPPVS